MLAILIAIIWLFFLIQAPVPTIIITFGVFVIGGIFMTSGNGDYSRRM